MRNKSDEFKRIILHFRRKKKKKHLHGTIYGKVKKINGTICYLLFII